MIWPFIFRRFLRARAAIGLVWLLAGAIGAFCQSAGTSPPCPVSSTGQDDSTLCVQLTLQGGQLQADTKQTVFTPSNAFKAALKIPISEASQTMIKDLNALFGKLPRLYWFGLTNDERDRDSKGTLKSSATDALRNFKGSWEAFRNLETAWRKENPQRFIDAQLLGQFFNAAQAPGMIWGATYPDPNPATPYNARTGVLQLKVADPINWDDKAHFSIQVDDTTNTGLDAPAVLELLRPLQGRLWRDPDIREFIAEAIGRRGITLNIEITDASQVPKQVHLTKAARVARVVFSPPVTDSSLSQTSDLDRTLYVLLEAELFGKYIGDRARYIKTPSALLQQLDYGDMGLAGSEPLFNTQTFGGQQAELKQLGFTAGYSTSGARADPSYVDIVLQKDTQTNAAQPKQAAAAGNGKSTMTGRAAPQRGTRLPASTTPVPSMPGPTAASAPSADGSSGSGPSPAPASEAPPSGTPADSTQKTTPLPPPRDKQNYIGGGFQYNPGQGVTPVVDYQYQRLLGPGSLSFETGSNNQNPLGTGNLNFDYLGFSKLHHRVAFSANASSALTVNRLLGAATLDERRTGVTARLEAEVLRNFHGGLLLLYIEGRRQTVDLSNPQGSGNTSVSAGKLNLTMVDFGSSFSWANRGAAHPWSLRFEPKVRHGLGLAASEPDFTWFNSTANYHLVGLGPLEFDVSGQFAWANDRTPLVELPSFGGVSSVRGFRSDDLLATQFWALQPELWMVIPGTGFSVSGAGAFLRRNARIAVFTDTGHVSHPVFGPAGYKAGPGVGIRFLQGPVVMQLDWAKAVGGAVTDSSWGRVYFNIRFN